MFSNPNSGDALVVFKTKGEDMALKKLNQACLKFSNGRSFVATCCRLQRNEQWPNCKYTQDGYIKKALELLRKYY